MPQYRGRIYEVELWDKPRSLELLGREKDTFKKQTVLTHDVSKNAAEFLLGSIQRADARKAELTSQQTVKDVTPITGVSAVQPETVIETRYEVVGPTPLVGFTKPPGVR